MHWRRKWQPIPVFLPGEPQGQGSLVATVCGVAQSQTRLKRLSSSSRDFRIVVEGWNEQSVSLLKGNTELATLHVQHPPMDFDFISINTYLSCLGLCILLLLWYHPELYCYCSLDTLGSLLFFKYSYMFPS